MTEGLTPVEVFCCYSRADEGWLQKLENHLSPLKRQGLISLWYDRLIPPGTNWVQTIDTHLETASVILLLVSSDFLASDYCYSVEMKRALEREEAREARETIYDLARFSETQGTSSEAKAWYARALTIREQALGMHHPKTTETRMRFITLLHAMGQHEEAAQLELVDSEQERLEGKQGASFKKGEKGN